MMQWPTPQEYREAIQNPEHNLSDSELSSAQVETDALGLPTVQSGQYAVVFKLSNRERSWAVRCFLHDFEDRNSRYRMISDFILRDDLEYTVGFELIESGIKIGNSWFPILKMEYVDAEPLGKYIRRNINDSIQLGELVANFDKMMLALKENGIAHGDLQHDNLLVLPDGRLRLIDYDGMYVPALSGWLSNELGHRNYQHPQRNETHFGPYLDNFSAWLIKGAIQCAIEDPVSKELLLKNDECFLLQREDLLMPNSSAVLHDLEKRAGASRSFSKRIRTLLKSTPESAPFLDQGLVPATDLPRIEVPKTQVKFDPENGPRTAASFAYAEPSAHIVTGQSQIRAAKAKRQLAGQVLAQSSSLPVGPNLLPIQYFPITFLCRADNKDGLSYKAKVRTALQQSLDPAENIVWTGGLNPRKLSTDRQYAQKPVKKSILTLCGILALLLALSPPLLSVVPAYVLAPLFMIGIVLGAIIISTELSQDNFRHVYYALTDSNLTICIETGHRTVNDEIHEWNVERVDIPLWSIRRALFTDGSEAATERVELSVDIPSQQGTMTPRIWLHGFSRAERQSLMTRLRSLGVQCAGKP